MSNLQKPQTIREIVRPKKTGNHFTEKGSRVVTSGNTQAPAAPQGGSAVPSIPAGSSTGSDSGSGT